MPPTTGSPPLAAHDEPSVHNSVLIRSHDPPRAAGRGWVMMLPVILAVIAGVAVLLYVEANPAPPLQNHAVAAVPSAP